MKGKYKLDNKSKGIKIQLKDVVSAKVEMNDCVSPQLLCGCEYMSVYLCFTGKKSIKCWSPPSFPLPCLCLTLQTALCQIPFLCVPRGSRIFPNLPFKGRAGKVTAEKHQTLLLLKYRLQNHEDTTRDVRQGERRMQNLLQPVFYQCLYTVDLLL